MMLMETEDQTYNEMKLYNDVMGIALAVWGHNGDCQAFRMCRR